MQLNDLKPPKGAKRKRKRVGRGEASGWGKTAGRGHKGQRSRSGGSIHPRFEGGQMPLFRRLPKRGFTPISKTRFQVLNVRDLEMFTPGTTVTPDLLKEVRLVRRSNSKIKLLGEGELTKQLVIQVHACSQSAATKVEAVGGRVEVI